MTEPATILSGEWVMSQEIDTQLPDIWYRVLVLTELPVKIVEHLNDGWLICEARPLRYKCWSSAVRKN